MKKLALLLIILFASCEAPTTGVSEADSNTFEKNQAHLKQKKGLKNKIGNRAHLCPLDDDMISSTATSSRWIFPL